MRTALYEIVKPLNCHQTFSARKPMSTVFWERKGFFFFLHYNAHPHITANISKAYWTVSNKSCFTVPQYSSDMVPTVLITFLLT